MGPPVNGLAIFPQIAVLLTYRKFHTSPSSQRPRKRKNSPRFLLSFRVLAASTGREAGRRTKQAAVEERLEGARQDRPPGLQAGQRLRIFAQASQERDDGGKRLGGGLGLGVSKRAGKTPPLPAGPQAGEAAPTSGEARRRSACKSPLRCASALSVRSLERAHRNALIALLFSGFCDKCF